MVPAASLTKHYISSDEDCEFLENRPAAPMEIGMDGIRKSYGSQNADVPAVYSRNTIRPLGDERRSLLLPRL
jgi:hypothetical protein